MEETKGDSVIWDNEVSPTNSMHKSDLLISDTSSLRFDYAFLYERPIITLEIAKENLAEYEANDMQENWNEKAATEIGIVVDKQTIINLAQIVGDLLEKYTAKDLQQFRSTTVKNFGNSAPHIIEYLKTIQIQQES